MKDYLWKELFDKLKVISAQGRTFSVVAVTEYLLLHICGRTMQAEAEKHCKKFLALCGRLDLIMSQLFLLENSVYFVVKQTSLFT